MRELETVPTTTLIDLMHDAEVSHLTDAEALLRAELEKRTQTPLASLALSYGLYMVSDEDLLAKRTTEHETDNIWTSIN